MLTEDFAYRFVKPIFAGHTFTAVGDYYVITQDGVELRKGFGWDGASGPTFDTNNSMRAALVHDVLYRAMASEQIDNKKFRKKVDREFRAILKQDGMFYLRRWGWWLAVRLFGGINARP